jgi:two-component system, NtrC family, nitrogen regulation sensor histidine kinase GlnL
MIEAQRQLASLPLAVLLLAPGLKLAAANPAAEQLLGQSFRRLSGRNLAEVLNFEEPRIAARLAENEAQLSAHAISVSPHGAPSRKVDLTLAPVIDQPGWQVLTLIDIGGAEALRDAPSAGEGGVLRAPEILAHEIKNPLAGIRGAAQLLGRKLDGKDLGLTNLIADEVDRIAKLIDQMQSLSSRKTLDLGPCNLHEAVRRARAVVEAAGDAPLIVEEFDPSLPPVIGNGDALVQILINLLTNAADATIGQNARQITIRTRFASGLQLHTGSDGTALRLPIELRVTDNGPGIPAELGEHMFEPFVSSKKSGQGLGLALVRRLLRDMNGRINHDRDDVGGLTHFRVHLPMAQQLGGKRHEEAA